MLEIDDFVFGTSEGATEEGTEELWMALGDWVMDEWPSGEAGVDDPATPVVIIEMSWSFVVF